MPASLPARPLTQPYRFRKICRTGFSLEKPEERPTAGSAGNQIAKFFQIQINSLTLNTEKGALSGSFFCVVKDAGCFYSRRLSLMHVFSYLCRSAKIPETTMRLSFFGFTDFFRSTSYTFCRCRTDMGRFCRSSALLRRSWNGGKLWRSLLSFLR